MPWPFLWLVPSVTWRSMVLNKAFPSTNERLPSNATRKALANTECLLSLAATRSNFRLLLKWFRILCAWIIARLGGSMRTLLSPQSLLT